MTTIAVWVLTMIINGQPIVVDNIATKADCITTGGMMQKDLKVIGSLSCVSVQKTVAK